MPATRPGARARLRETLRYLVCAGSVALLYLALLAIGLTFDLHYFLAILIAQVITITVAFPIYRTFVFRSQGRISVDFLRFLSVWATGAIAGIIVTPLLVELVHLHPLVAQIIAIVIVSIGSFLAHRFFSFRTTDATLVARSSPAEQNERV